VGQIRRSRSFSVDPPDPFATGCRIFPISDVDTLVERPPIGFAPRLQLRPARSIAKLPIPHFPRHAAPLSNDLPKIRERTTADKTKTSVHHTKVILLNFMNTFDSSMTAC
jgi:hypothetical protein